MELGGLLIIVVVFLAFSIPVCLWGAFGLSKNKKKGVRISLLILALIATAVSICFLIFALRVVLFGLSSYSIEREEEKIVCFDNGDSFRITMRIEYLGFKGERYCEISIYDKEGRQSAVYYDPTSGDDDPIVQKWDEIKLAIDDNDLVCYETAWCVLYRFKIDGNVGLRSVTDKNYKSYREYVTVYEKAKNTSR